MKLTDDTKFAIAARVELALNKRFSGWSDIGNRADYIASDCKGRGADFHSVSTGIISVAPCLWTADIALRVKWGARAEFYDEGRLSSDLSREHDAGLIFLAYNELMTSGFKGDFIFDDSLDATFMSEGIFEVKPSYAFKKAVLSKPDLEGLSESEFNSYAVRIFREFKRVREPLKACIIRLRKRLKAKQSEYWDEWVKYRNTH